MQHNLLLILLQRVAITRRLCVWWDDDGALQAEPSAPQANAPS
jgi:hypothetical protein